MAGEVTAELEAQVRELVENPDEHRDAPTRVLALLQGQFSPADVSVPGSPAQLFWQACGTAFMDIGRVHEAIPIFAGLYDHMLCHQQATGEQVHKGMPLVWISECYARARQPAHAKRYLMLTTCEDAIQDHGVIDRRRGVYFRAVWHYGMTETKLDAYARTIWEKAEAHDEESLFPEWVLQELDQDWMTEYPSPSEALHYAVNGRYICSLLARLGSGDGKALERLAHYVLTAMPGCRARMRQRSHSTDYDVVASLEGTDLDFRSELGRYFVCECKDWGDPAGFTTFAKFCRVLDSTKCRFGIIFSKEDISGKHTSEDPRHALREQLKVFQDRGMVIVVVSEEDLTDVAAGDNFITLLRSKYEAVRLDLQDR